MGRGDRPRRPRPRRAGRPHADGRRAVPVGRQPRRPAGRALMLVTVVGSRRADVTLAPDIPMAELLPQLVALCGAPAGGAPSLAMARGQPLGPHTTPGDNGVLARTALYPTDRALAS